MSTHYLKSTQRIVISENSDYSDPEIDFSGETTDSSILLADRLTRITAATLTPTVTNVNHILNVKNKSATAAEAIDIYWYDIIGTRTFANSGLDHYTFASATQYMTLTDDASAGTFITALQGKANAVMKIVSNTTTNDGTYPIKAVAANVIDFYKPAAASAITTYGTLTFMFLNHIQLAAGQSCSIPCTPSTDMDITFTPRSGTPQIELVFAKLA